jgi:murein L,D-transpeptidase YcbB/YkuD
MSNRTRLFMRYFFLGLSLLFITTKVFAIEAMFPTIDNKISQMNTQPTTAIELSFAQQNYQKLQQVLQLYQNAVMHPWPVIESDRLLKVGMHSSNVPLLRMRLRMTNELPFDYNHTGNLYDSELAEAVRLFQEHNGLQADGILGKNTLLELNIPPAVRVNQIEVNMQRWSNLSRQLGSRFIMVNIPDYRLHVYEDNQEVLTMKAIVGKPTAQTPELNSQVKRLVFNPPWNVPVKIAQKELVKKAMEDPTYLDQNHIRIFDSPESNAAEINQYDVDWQAAETNGFPYHFRQDPGDDNSLGLVKFEFQNSHDVYLHDTPAKELFNQDTRDLSHGCVRLENAFALVDYLMRDNPEWTQEQIQDILAEGKTKYIKAYRPIPILITYITAWVGDDGALNFRDDVYGKDN